MRRDRTRKRHNYEQYRIDLLWATHRRIEHSCYKDRPKMRMYFENKVWNKPDWNEFLDRYLIKIDWNYKDLQDKVYRGAQFYFQLDDRIYVLYYSMGY